LGFGFWVLGFHCWAPNAAFETSLPFLRADPLMLQGAKDFAATANAFVAMLWQGKAAVVLAIGGQWGRLIRL
jgi:hypothetical protein